ncbi:unnamed protein product [Hymenolepis diminuta]|uniref:Uncharacterized protein n=1 Tax=Hymenolepis diminuta TaxID=6216 RepID=A0A564ZAP1_HYMDI|nr:unnamed protein product [Hymenolepis diminuta]
MMFFTIQQIKLSRSGLFVIAKSSVLSSLHVIDIASMRSGDYDNCPLVISIMVEVIHKIAHAICAHRVTPCRNTTASLHSLSSVLTSEFCCVGGLS